MTTPQDALIFYIFKCVVYTDLLELYKFILFILMIALVCASLPCILPLILFFILNLSKS